MSAIQPGTVQVPLYRRDGTVCAYTTIDATDVEFVHQWRWRLSRHTGRHRYAVRGQRVAGVFTCIYLARELLGLPRAKDDREADHRNHDTLDNRRENLRVLSDVLNRQNLAPRGGTSLYRGVGWHRGAGRWSAYARVNNSRHHLGLYVTELDAAKAAARWRAAHMPGTIEDAALLHDPAPQRAPRRGRPIGHLTPVIVIEARQRYAAGGVSVQQLAREYRISRPGLEHAINGRTWKHIA